MKIDRTTTAHRGLAVAASIGVAVVLFGSGAPPTFAQPSGTGEGAKVCSWFTPAEIAKYLGVAVEAGQVNGPLNSQCQWKGKSASPAFISIQIVRRSDWEDPHLADGYKRVQGIGETAYVVPQLGGWQAGARTATKVVAVSGLGGTLTAEKTLDVLRAAVNHP